MSPAIRNVRLRHSPCRDTRAKFACNQYWLPCLAPALESSGLSAPYSPKEMIGISPPSSCFLYVLIPIVFPESALPWDTSPAIEGVMRDAAELFRRVCLTWRCFCGYFTSCAFRALQFMPWRYSLTRFSAPVTSTHIFLEDGWGIPERQFDL